MYQRPKRYIAYLIRAIITSDLLSEDEDFLVTKHFFLHCNIESIPNCHLDVQLVIILSRYHDTYCMLAFCCCICSCSLESPPSTDRRGCPSIGEKGSKTRKSGAGNHSLFYFVLWVGERMSWPLRSACRKLSARSAFDFGTPRSFIFHPDSDIRNGPS